ncbi:hypothetical protein ACLOJK_017696 [Asimina triloba]
MEINGKKPIAKSRGTFHFLRVAFYMLRRRSSNRKPSMQMQVVEKSGWRRLMCLVRPLHSTSLQSSAAPALAIKHHAAAPAEDSFHELALLPPPASPDIAPPPRVYEDGMTSRYMSAEDLQDLEGGQQGGGDGLVAVAEEDREESGDANHEIDMQAEEFIAKFYEEMRLQRAESINRYNRWLQQQQASEEV